MYVFYLCLCMLNATDKKFCENCCEFPEDVGKIRFYYSAGQWCKLYVKMIREFYRRPHTQLCVVDVLFIYLNPVIAVHCLWVIRGFIIVLLIGYPQLWFYNISFLRMIYWCESFYFNWSIVSDLSSYNFMICWISWYKLSQVETFNYKILFTDVWKYFFLVSNYSESIFCLLFIKLLFLKLI